MEVKPGVELFGLQPVMRKVLRVADALWRHAGRSEGVTVVSTVDSVHSAGSWHPYGYAVDLRTFYFSEQEARDLHVALKEALPDYDVILHTTGDVHIHVEIGNVLAEELGVLF